jgi:hypothetical protein
MPTAVKAPSIRPAASSSVVPQSLNWLVEMRFSHPTNEFEALPQGFLYCDLVRRAKLSNNVEFRHCQAAFEKLEPIEQLLPTAGFPW